MDVLAYHSWDMTNVKQEKRGIEVTPRMHVDSQSPRGRLPTGNNSNRCRVSSLYVIVNREVYIHRLIHPRLERKFSGNNYFSSSSKKLNFSTNDRKNHTDC